MYVYYDACDDVYSDADGLVCVWHDPRVALRPYLDTLDIPVVAAAVVVVVADKNDIDACVYVDAFADAAAAAAVADAPVYPSCRH